MNAFGRGVFAALSDILGEAGTAGIAVRHSIAEGCTSDAHPTTRAIRNSYVKVRVERPNLPSRVNPTAAVSLTPSEEGSDKYEQRQWSP
jgi:hypothetical protein